MLSAILKRDGFDTIPIDFMSNRHKPHVHVLSMDLRLESTWRFQRYAVVTRRVLHVHAGPPCGTCSRAQGIRLDDGRPGPRPLRDEDNPLGFSNLTRDELDRVHSANSIYLQLAAFVQWLHQLGLGFSIENPTNSLLWWMPAYRELLSFSWFVNFDACMHGSERLKHTSFLTNVHELNTLAVQCDGKHAHKPWGLADGQFATAQEAAYPKQLCESVSNCMQLRARNLGYAIDNVTLPQDAATRRAAQIQPRRRAGPPLMTEYHYTQTVTTADSPELDTKSCLCKPFHAVPQGSKLIRKTVKGGGVPDFCFTFGVYRTQHEFLRDARLLQHPFDMASALPDAMIKALAFILSAGKLNVLRRRIATLQKWNQWEKELRNDERKLHETLEPGVERVLAGKNLLLLERIASDLQWPDVHLHNDIRSGFKLTGNPQPSGVFDLDFKPAALEEHELGTKMQYFKHALWEKVAEQAEQDFTVPLWDITCEECQVKNWLVGPFTWDELETRYNKNWLPCRRFAVWQSNKWRPIDDLSENGVNAAYTVCEKISLRALDETIWCAMTLMRMSRDRGSFTFKLSDGSVLSAKVHDSWPGCGDHGKPHVKTVDLKSAYKQWAIAPTERCKTVVTLQDPSTGAAAGFECLTLPFGAISSVICFNRIARLYQRVLHEVLVLAANYYDDYPV